LRSSFDRGRKIKVLKEKRREKKATRDPWAGDKIVAAI